MRRRTFLATVGAGTLAGCSALGGPKFERATDAFTNVQQSEEGETTVTTGLAVIPDGQYATFSFALAGDGEVALSGQVTQNPPMDFYIMGPDQFTEFQREPNLISAAAESEQTSTPDISIALAAGEYVGVFDNTYIGEAGPSGEARMDFRFALTAPEGTTTPSN